MSDEHIHQFGRGANGVCRGCGEESNAGRNRRLIRESRPAETRTLDLYEALAAKSGFDYEGNAQ